MSDRTVELSFESTRISDRLYKILGGNIDNKRAGICYNLKYKHAEEFVTQMCVGWKGITEPCTDPMGTQGFGYKDTISYEEEEYFRWQEPQRSLRMDLASHLRRRVEAGDWDRYVISNGTNPLNEREENHDY